MDYKDTLERIEEKIDQIIESQSQASTEIRWIKTVGTGMISAIAYVFHKIYGGP